MNHANAAQLQDIFRVVFNMPAETDVSDISVATNKKWDSLITITLITAIESEFDVTLETSQYEALSSFDAARLILESHGL